MREQPLDPTPNPTPTPNPCPCLNPRLATTLPQPSPNPDLRYEINDIEAKYYADSEDAYDMRKRDRSV